MVSYSIQWSASLGEKHWEITFLEFILLLNIRPNADIKPLLSLFLYLPLIHEWCCTLNLILLRNLRPKNKTIVVGPSDPRRSAFFSQVCANVNELNLSEWECDKVLTCLDLDLFDIITIAFILIITSIITIIITRFYIIIMAFTIIII